MKNKERERKYKNAQINRERGGGLEKMKGARKDRREEMWEGGKRGWKKNCSAWVNC